MATIPFSNPAGNNQLTPRGGGVGVGSNTTKTPIPGSPAATPVGANPGVPMNPYMPPSTGVPAAQSTATTSPTSAQNGFITDATGSNGTNNLNKQLTDIYGKGVGTSLFDLLNGMSGTDSTILQEYIQSLQPQMATAQANVNSALGAGGVNANSSTAAIADASLQGQEFSSIAGESAALTQNQEQLTAQILTGTEGAAAKEVATSGWSIFGDVMNNITGDIGNLVGGSFKTPGNSPTPTIPGSSPIGQAGASASGIQATDPSLYNPPEIDAEDAGASLAAFA